MFRPVPELTALSIFVNLASAPVATHRRLILVEDTFCRREDTVRKLFAFSYLRESYKLGERRRQEKLYLQLSFQLHYIGETANQYISGGSFTERAVERRPQFLCANSRGIVNEETFGKSYNVIVIVDEAQLSYIMLSATGFCSVPSAF
jgi:hypothetical protein